MRGLLLAVLTCLALARSARAEHIHSPAGFSFQLPNLGAPWEIDDRGSFIEASWGDRVPELRLFLFAVDREDSLDHLQRDLGGVIDKIEHPLQATIKPFKLVEAKRERIAGAQAIIGQATANGTKIAFALVQRDGRTVVLVGIPADGIYDRGLSNFRATVHSLEPKPSNAIARDVLPNIPELVGVRAVTATSTYADKRDLYAPWRTLLYDVTADGTTSVPLTAWCEGRPDEGLGETITIQLARPTPLTQIRIAAGVWLSQKLFDANNQITSLEVALDGKVVKVAPARKREFTTITVGAAVSTIAIKIVAVKRGKMNDSCLSAIVLDRDGNALRPLLDVDGTAAEDLPRALAKLQTALGDEAHKGLDALIGFPFTVHENDSETAAHKPVRYTSWSELAKACRGTGCPSPVSLDPTDDRSLGVTAAPNGTVVVEFPSHNEYTTRWRLQWKTGAWQLQSTDRDLRATGHP